MEDIEALRAFARYFGDKVRNARRQQNMTQLELAIAIHSTRNNIIRIEAGKATYMPARRALEICQTLGINLIDIWRELNANSFGVSDGSASKHNKGKHGMADG